MGIRRRRTILVVLGTLKRRRKRLTQPSCMRAKKKSPFLVPDVPTGQRGTILLVLGTRKRAKKKPFHDCPPEGAVNALRA